MTALTMKQLLDIDPAGRHANREGAYEVAIRHAWNYAVLAEGVWEDEAEEEARTNAAISQAWAAIAGVLK